MGNFAVIDAWVMRGKCYQVASIHRTWQEAANYAKHLWWLTAVREPVDDSVTVGDFIEVAETA